ncbi:MAG: Macrolide export ATP-binding/permease protein MacB [Candidatus Saccharicenans subterraneus]|uniref:Macrolide export ATP-binding/permease protein MacB n=1 Tax=Candidatus Saccharicenans subterraneus TaxID=2508984 RepID=A0A3E2BQB7_9BACT|nr:MAG: Macrolide export ATP-binding/permease protein MacB [Candidatus Saccharicenans subterraneum]
MKILRILRVSMRALARNKMRSFLTILGIIIGVAAVIAMVSIGEGAKKGIEERFASMGTNLLFVYPGSRNIRGVQSGFGGFTNLKPDDAKAIEERCDAVKATSPSINTRAQVVYANKNWNTQIQGTGEKFPEIRNWRVVEGVYFDESHVASGAKVCVLGSLVKQNLFEDEDPIGKTIRINKIPFTVIGVLESKGEQGGFFNRDDMIAAPYTTVMRRLRGVDYINSIDVAAVSADKTSEAQRQIEELMRERHRIAPGAEDDFQVRNIADVAESAAESTKIMTILLGSIAGISLIVGGIGIMNIMLVSVTERIREIGVRLAVGARERDILLQFLIEAVVLSVTGGVIGIIVGVGASRLMKYISLFSNITTVVTPESIMLAFFFAASVGIFFGYYPARKASKLDPIEALRYE